MDGITVEIVQQTIEAEIITQMIEVSIPQAVIIQNATILGGNTTEDITANTDYNMIFDNTYLS